MNKRNLPAWLPLLVLALLAVGSSCKRDDSSNGPPSDQSNDSANTAGADAAYAIAPVEPVGAKSPQEQLSAMYRAVLDKNETAFRACFVQSDDRQQDAFLQAMYRQIVLAGMFKDAVVKTYGADAWQEFLAHRPSNGPRANLGVFTAEEFADLQANAIAIDQEGDTAQTSLTTMGVLVVLKRSGDLWYVDPQGSARGIPFSAAIRILQKQSAAIEQATARAINERPPLSKLNEDLGKALFNAGSSE